MVKIYSYHVKYLEHYEFDRNYQNQKIINFASNYQLASIDLLMDLPGQAHHRDE